MDMIVQNEAADGRADLSFTVVRDELPGTLRAVDEAVREIGAEGCDYDDERLEDFGGWHGDGDPARRGRRDVRALADKGINVQMITTSQIKISVVVARKSALEALLAVHEAFALHVPPAAGGADDRTDDRGGRAPDPFKLAAKLVARLQRMEKLIIEGIDLDESQARVTFVGLPDTPGVAAEMFDKLAEAGIVVDMIVQSAGRGRRADITVTVPAADLQKTVAVAAGCRTRSAPLRRPIPPGWPSCRYTAWA